MPSCNQYRISRQFFNDSIDSPRVFQLSAMQEMRKPAVSDEQWDPGSGMKLISVVDLYTVKFRHAARRCGLGPTGRADQLL